LAGKNRKRFYTEAIMFLFHEDSVHPTLCRLWQESEDVWDHIDQAEVEEFEEFDHIRRKVNIEVKEEFNKLSQFDEDKGKRHVEEQQYEGESLACFVDASADALDCWLCFEEEVDVIDADWIIVEVDGRVRN
jgi:hypothetical protein